MSPRGSKAAPQWGQLVVNIELKTDANLRIQDFHNFVTQKIGEPLDRAKVTETLKSLYSTGRFTDLLTETEPAVGGINLIFVGRAQFFVGIVRVEGAPGDIETRVLVTASRLRLGQSLTDDALATAQQHMIDVLESNGYHAAKVRHGVRPNADTQETEITFTVTPGRPAHLAGVEFRGHAVFPPARLASVARWHPGMHLNSTRLERGLFRLHQFYLARGRLQATASLEDRVFDPKTNSEKLGIQVDAGPLIEVRLEGAKLRYSKVKKLLPVFRDGVVDEPALSRNERVLEDYFQQEGFLSATVEAQRVTRTDPDHLMVTFRVKLGMRGEFAGYGIKGNHSISTSDLMAAITAPPQGLFPPPPKFSRQLVGQKMTALAAVYRSRGFLETKIRPNIDEEYAHQQGVWFVTFEIDEGPRTTIRNLVVSGVEPETQKKLWATRLCKPGQPFSPERAKIDRDSMLDYLADQGYSHAAIAYDTKPVAGKHQVDLEFRIEPGALERIQRIVVMGNQHTREGIIRRELVIRDGEPLNQSSVLESQRRLYELGVFNQVQMAIQDPSEKDVNKTALVSVEEGKRWTVGYGGGLEVQRLGSNNPQGSLKASPRVSLDVTRLNVGGRAQTFTLRGRLSNLETGGAIGYLVPRLLNRRDLALRINGLIDRSNDVLTFTADRREASISVEKRFSATTLILTRYSFRHVRALDLSNRITQDQLPLLSRPATIGMFGGSYINDHRDDPTDATRGSYSLADVGVAWQKLGSEADFLRFSGQNSTYYRLGKHLVFARNTRLGIESPFGGLRRVVVNQGSNPPQVLFTHDIPLPERFFMGGSESHRGFSINQAGPRDSNTGFPVGGNALFFNSLELRVPFAERRLGLAFFHDAGNVFSTVRKMRLLKFVQNSPTDLDYDVHAVGMGIRYRTPVGPLRIDGGYNLNPPQFQVVNQVNGVPNVEVRTLSRWQFFLSIGQSF